MAQGTAPLMDAALEAVADALPRFSYDLARLVCRYAFYGAITLNAQPVLLRQWRLDSVGCSYGAACAPNGWMWATSIQPTSMQGGKITAFGENGEMVHHTPMKDSPVCIAFDDVGDAFVTDRALACVHVFNHAGDRQRSFPLSHGQLKLSSLSSPWGVATHKSGLVYVADGEYHQKISCFRRDGTFLRRLERCKRRELQDLRGLACGHTELFAACRHLCDSHIRVFDALSGKALRAFDLPAGAAPSGLAVDGAGNLLVADLRGKVLVCATDGSLLTQFDTTPYSGEHVCIEDVCVDLFNRVIALTENGTVIVFAFPRA